MMKHKITLLYIKISGLNVTLYLVNQKIKIQIKSPQSCLAKE